MKIVYWIVGLIILAIGLLFALTTYMQNRTKIPSEEANATSTTTLVEVVPIEHASGFLRWGDTALYFDPVGERAIYEGLPDANIILLTDVHGDHFSTSTLMNFSGGATLVVPQAVFDMLPEELRSRAEILANGESSMILDFKITAVPMYNLPESENANFHTKGRGNGYIVERDQIRVYIAGDTAGTPEMRALTDINIALVPMNLPYTMSVDEAADAVIAFKPREVYPYHFRGQDGLADVNRFRDLVTAGDPNITVTLADWYPNEE